MKHFLILAGLLPSLACAQTQTTKPQFIPPNGLPLNTPLGQARNADGTGVITFETMQAGIAAAVTAAELTEALTPYLTQSSAAAEYFPLSGGSVSGDVTFSGKIYASGYTPTAPGDKSAFLCADATNGYLYPATAPCIPAYVDPKYATPDSVATAVESEAARAKDAENVNASAIEAVRESSVTPDALTSALTAYLKSSDAEATYMTKADAAEDYYTQPQSDARYTTPSQVSASVQKEADRATAAEQSNTVKITSLQASSLSKSEGASTYLPLAGGILSGNIRGGAMGGQAGYKIGPSVFEGQLGAPDDELNQGSSIAWNTLGGLAGSGSYGETDFYNLHGLGTGGFTFCDGGTVAECQANILMTVNSSGVVFSRAASISGNVNVTGNATISGSATLTGAAGTGNAYACISAAGQLYRSSAACQ